MNWVYMENKATAGSIYVPDEPGVVEWHDAHGWDVAEPPAETPFVPPVNGPVSADAEWVTLTHPKLDGAAHDFPNNPDAIGGALDSGWEFPKPPAAKPESKPKPKASASATTEKE